MKRDELQRLAQERLKDAEALIGVGRFDGAYYLAGYAVECALKAAIAKRFRRHEVPTKALVDKFYQHDLGGLLRLADEENGGTLQRELEARLQLRLHWNTVKQWKPERRYSLGVSEAEARDFLRAVAARGDGVLAWLKRRW
ncbi:MAG: HEPN domain-containing protein [Candidatus Methylomirabilis sp.]|nr:HEPN domain-containing protein [Deltaproteobacteria bacterium]